MTLFLMYCFFLFVIVFCCAAAAAAAGCCQMSALWERCLLTICGGANLRAMSMNFIPAEEVEKLNATGWQNINKNADVLGEQGMRLERPCLPGGCCGVPFRIFVSSGGGEELGAFLPNPSFLFSFH